jgi:hypothetical protein
MIKVFATTEDGEGFVQFLGEYESMDEIHIYTSALGRHVEITFFDDYGEEEAEERMDKMQMSTTDYDDEDEWRITTKPLHVTVGASTGNSRTRTNPSDLGSGEI